MPQGKGTYGKKVGRPAKKKGGAKKAGVRIPGPRPKRKMRGGS